MGAGRIARDGETEADTARLQIAAFVQATERAERFFATGLGNARTVVVDRDLDETSVAVEADRHMRAVFQRVVDQICHTTPEQLAADGKNDRLDAFDFQPTIAVGTLRRRDDLLEEFGKFDTLHVFAAFTAREIEIFVEHMFHLDDVFLQRHRVRALAHHRQLQFYARQRRLEIVADACKHFGTLLDIAFDARAHGDESLSRAAHFGRAIRLEIRDFAALAERLRCEGQPLDRAHLIAQKKICDAQKYQRGDDHPQHENGGARRHQPLFANDKAKDAVLQLHLQVDILPNSVSLERIGRTELLREEAVHRILQARREMT